MCAVGEGVAMLEREGKMMYLFVFMLGWTFGCWIGSKLGEMEAENKAMREKLEEQ